MATQSQSSRGTPAVLATQSVRRGRVACSACHARRIRCNAFQGCPCSNCIASKEKCQLIESKRGKYTRTHSKAAPGRLSWPAGNENSQRSRDRAGATAAPVLNASAFHPTLLDSSAAAEYNPGHALHAESPPWVRNTSHLVGLVDRHEIDRSVREGSEMLYARLSEFHLSRLEPPKSSSNRTVYLGESFPLTYIVHEVVSPTYGTIPRSPSKLQYPVPASVDDTARNLGYDTRLGLGEISYLKWKGALLVPDKSFSDRLVRTFFECVHPAFPIFDRIEFAAQYNSNQLSLLTLQAVYLLAVTLCDEDLIKAAGFVDRNAARNTFQKRARALYDADYETDKLSIVTALLLISFCWNGSMDEKDMWHWLGASIGLAQTLGMHRSTARSDLSLKDRAIWKRIWWSLYVRDRHSAAALGRPMRIRDEDCDIEPLEESDFLENVFPDPTIFGLQTRTHVLYAIYQAKLFVIFGDVLSKKFTVKRPARIETAEAELAAKLKTWLEGVPRELILRNANDAGHHEYWANVLGILYNYQLILLHRPVRGSIPSSGESSERIAFAAAKAITRVVDDLLNSETLRQSQLHIVPSVFATLTMHVIVIGRSGSMQRKLAENHARLCMLALSEWQKSWPVGGWILQLFESLLKNPVAVGNELSQASSNAFALAPEINATEVFPRFTTTSKPDPQPSWNGIRGHHEADYNFPTLNSNILSQNPEPPTQLNFYDEADEPENTDGPAFSQVYFNSSNPLTSGLASSGTDSSANNQEFLSYLMKEFPDA